MKTCRVCEQEKAIEYFEPQRKVCKECRKPQKNGAKFLCDALKGNQRIVLAEGDSFHPGNEWTIEKQEVRQSAKGEQRKYSLRRTEPKPLLFPEIKPVRYHLPDRNVPRVKQPQPSTKTALIIPDSQNGFIRDLYTGTLEPMHDTRAWELVFQIADRIQPDTIVLLGDMLDLCDQSIKYSRSPEFQQTTQQTLDDFALTLSRLRSGHPESEIVYLEGNHEKRLEIAIDANLQSCYGLRRANKFSEPPVMSIPYLLGLEELAIEYLPYPDGVYRLNDNLICIHGLAVKQGFAQTAQHLLNSMDESVIFGHIHRHELCYQTFHKFGQRKVKFAGSPGCLCRIDGAIPGTRKHQNWQQGCFVVTYDQSDFSVESVLIHEGRSTFRGELLTAD
jgi:predicted phosphodiesterase